jgi:hypothetical protein
MHEKGAGPTNEAREEELRRISREVATRRREQFFAEKAAVYFTRGLH